MLHNDRMHDKQAGRECGRQPCKSQNGDQRIKCERVAEMKQQVDQMIKEADWSLQSEYSTRFITLWSGR
jgi:hypothetical protein